jgi:hypothetical protein
MLKTCRKYYELALQVFFGEGLLVLLSKLKNPNSITELHALANKLDDEAGEWLDVSGLFIPLHKVELLIEEIKDGKKGQIQQIQDYFSEQLNQYGSYKASYFKNLLKEIRDIDLNNITALQVIELINGWKSASIKLNNMILKDAEKEFDATSHLGYGISPTEVIRNTDFAEVHGSFDSNGFVKGLKAEIELVNQKAEEIIAAFN